MRHVQSESLKAVDWSPGQFLPPGYQGRSLGSGCRKPNPESTTMTLQMRQAAESGTLITSRRNFLVRAFGVTAAGAAITVPIVTIPSARERVRHHLAGLEAAFSEL